jgi:hypothetical protein
VFVHFFTFTAAFGVALTAALGAAFAGLAAGAASAFSLRAVLVHVVCRGVRFNFCKYCRHFREQKLNILPSFLTNNVPVPMGMVLPQNEHRAIIRHVLPC